MNLLSRELELVARASPIEIQGRVATVRGMTIFATDLPVPIGSLVHIHGLDDLQIAGEVVGFDDGRTIVMLLAATTGIVPGSLISMQQVHQVAPVGAHMLGRVLDGMGRPIDGLGPIPETVQRPINPDPIGAMNRRRIQDPLRTGVRVLDLMTPIGRGQRLGIFAGPGVGKSTLLGQIARGTDADVNVIALIGERGREVRDFIDHALGAEGLKRSVVIVATGDESPLLRIRAAKLACTASEFFRDQGQDVLLMMDSVTRFAHAQRQVGLSVGEPPTTKGYTPSVFSSMAELLERAGTVESADGTGGGSITGLYTILVEGDDMSEPVSDAARGILDGHVVLSRKIAQSGQYPAVDVLDSVSRVASDVTDSSHQASKLQISKMIAKFRDVEDLVQIGAYAQGANPEADTAIDLYPVINELLGQRTDEQAPFEPARDMMVKLAIQSGDMIQQRRAFAQSQQSQGAPTVGPPAGKLGS
ncbi:MAG: FliI/YscN family ATPase [Phycisphaerales bacterium]